MIGSHALTAAYRGTELPPLKAMPQGLDAIVHGWAGSWRRWRDRRRGGREEGESIHRQAQTLRDRPERQLQEEIHQFRAIFRRRAAVPAATLSTALAAVAEVARRLTGLSAHPVQLMAALAAYRGYLLEMATGEGKTLTVALAAVLHGWSGRPCHIVTANDYLAARDAEWLAPFYAACGLIAGAVTSEMPAEQRRSGYACDLTYTTSKEVVADFLRDRLQLGDAPEPIRRLLRGLLRPETVREKGLVMRGLHTAIVDEADSALIDEAVTPLLISREQDNEPLRQACEAAHRLALTLERGADYDAEPRLQEIRIRSRGLASLEARAGELPGMWRGAQRAAELVTQALRAREFYHRDKQYVVEDGKIVIVDEFTGRLMPQRTWREGLHQAVEAKEKLTVTTPSETLARLSFQRFFRLYRRLSGLSGTVWEGGPEAWHIYRLPVMRIPTHRPCVRVELPDRVFPGQEQKWEAIVEEIVFRHGRGQPVLAGTRSVAASEQLAARLAARGLTCSLLNATRHREEAEIVSQAGQHGRVTVATNMAGRGTDIKLGPLVAEAGGLHVLLTERNESRRIDRQLMGRAARQGDPGSAQAFVAMDDDLLIRNAGSWARQRAATALRAGLPGAVGLAQRVTNRAQRHSEAQAFRQRRRVLEMDGWVEDALSFTGEAL